MYKSGNTSKLRQDTTKNVMIKLVIIRRCWVSYNCNRIWITNKYWLGLDPISANLMTKKASAELKNPKFYCSWRIHLRVEVILNGTIRFAHSPSRNDWISRPCNVADPTGCLYMPASMGIYQFASGTLHVKSQHCDPHRLPWVFGLRHTGLPNCNVSWRVLLGNSACNPHSKETVFDNVILLLLLNIKGTMLK